MTSNLYLYFTFRGSEFFRVFLAPSNWLQDASVRVRPDVVSLVPPIVVNADISTAHLDDGCHADEVVEFVASLQLHSGGESVRNDVLKRI